MSLSDFGNWASIIGLIITIITFLLTTNVNRKVNSILKSQNDRSYFDKKVKIYLPSLVKLLSIAQTAQEEVLFSTKQYTSIYNAIQLVLSSWDVLMQYEKTIPKKIKIYHWKRKFTELQNMYNGKSNKDINKLISFLTEFIIFLEKEQKK